MSPSTREDALKLIRQWKRRQQLQACTLDVPAFVSEPLLAMGSIGRSEACEIYIDGQHTRYRVLRCQQWVSLPVVSIQHH